MEREGVLIGSFWGGQRKSEGMMFVFLLPPVICWSAGDRAVAVRGSLHQTHSQGEGICVAKIFKINSFVLAELQVFLPVGSISETA